MTSLIGQPAAETLLARAVAADRVAHAYLFLGPAGVGKATAARLFAQAVNCAVQPAARREEATWRLAPCGACENCRRIAAGTHPEVMELAPDSPTGQDLSVKLAQAIRVNVALRPKLTRRRTYLFPNAEALNEHSGSALLKTLEEPSESAVLVLCAPTPGQVLPTIRSRCQTVRFGLAPPAEIEAGLRARGADPETARTLSRACRGLPGVALAWLESPALLERRGRVLEIFARALRAQHRGQPALGVLAFRLAEELARLAADAREADPGPKRPAKQYHDELLETSQAYLRDLLLLRQQGDPELAHNQDRLAELQELADGAGAPRSLTDLRTVREAQELLEHNVAPALLLERMFWALISGPTPSAADLFEEALV